tara:strand:+ start:143 stop:997 length:855 start_codon:yes stop_codon:yes gene_type:complete
MSKFLSAVAVTEFDSMVKQAYQGMGMLRPTVTQRNNVVADIYKFRRMGKGLANQKSTSDLVTPMNVEHELITCVLANWNAPEYTDMFDAAEVNFDEKQELAETVAGALGRRDDQIIIDALDASTPLTSTVLTSVGGAASNMNMAKIIRAKVELKKQGVNTRQGGQFHAVIEADGLSGLLNDETVTSGDYQAIKALVNGEVNTLAGFNFHILEDRVEGGLTEAANIVDSYFYHTQAVGLATGIAPKTEINWIPERTSWLTNGMLKSGAVVRDSGGLVKVQYTKTA